MIERYAIINEAGGWLENIIVLDTADANGWVPENGTIIKLASEVDFSTLPQNPADIVKYNAEEWLKNQGYDATQLVTFTDMERQLAEASKSSPKMSSVRTWANGILAEYVTNPVSKSDWTPAPFTFNQAITEAFNLLNT